MSWRLSLSVFLSAVRGLRAVGSGVAAGSTYDSVSYSTTNGPLCLSLTLVLHSVNAGALQTQPPAFDKEQESAVLVAIISTFKWTGR